MRPPLALADIGAKLMTTLDPERAHRLTVSLLAKGLGPKPALSANPRLRVRLAGLEFHNPLGLAAGFDKNAQAANAALDLGFSFVEVGAATPRPQQGNERPRVFRLKEDGAVINRYGFNNEGFEAIAARLAARERRGIVGVNLGANKDSEDRTADYVAGIARFEGLVDFYTINISSPNTPGLRALQDKASLDALLARVLKARAGLNTKAPVFLKVAPDLQDTDKADIAASAREARVDALIVSNTTIARPTGLRSPLAREKGGLSGAPLMGPSTALLREFHQSLDGAVPIIGVGGVASARDAYAKILAGASLVQLYTALVYEGPGLVARIIRELPQFLDADGLESVTDAIGKG